MAIDNIIWQELRHGNHVSWEDRTLPIPSDTTVNPLVIENWRGVPQYAFSHEGIKPDAQDSGYSIVQVPTGDGPRNTTQIWRNDGTHVATRTWDASTGVPREILVMEETNAQVPVDRDLGLYGTFFEQLHGDPREYRIARQ